ncbi:outer membrane beta-barrel protein [Alloalcanivorax profundimaris]|uniref:outer membrane beta-barrel protein n=1 Tax=Alloalcanivorax profundimaris TaxID=2735259 RepID=UPI00188936EE|nr:outer membrane beta-barrel protein [Alloalcanivorax profundimaris]MBF1803427.1 porin family protein [Alloalcanivorax profundimaris]
MKKQFLLAAAVSSLTILPLTAQADVGFLVGAAAARDQSNLDDFIDKNSPLSASSADAEIGTDIYIGLAANDMITFRLGHRSFGDAETDITDGFAVGQAELEADGIYLAVDAMFAVTETFYVGGTLGNQDVDMDFTIRGPGGAEKIKDDARDFFYGLRAAWFLSEQAAITGSFNRYKFEVEDADEDIEYDSLAVGLEYRF